MMSGKTYLGSCKVSKGSFGIRRQSSQLCALLAADFFAASGTVILCTEHEVFRSLFPVAFVSIFSNASPSVTAKSSADQHSKLSFEGCNADSRIYAR